jgi:hypothetical protein
MLQFLTYARLRKANMTDAPKRFWSVTKKIILFGLFFGIGVVGAGAGVMWYMDRPEPSLPPKSWGELSLPTQGIKYRLTTEWQDETRYIFEVQPLDKSLIDAFEAADDGVDRATSGAYWFTIELRDLNNFRICSIVVPIGGGDSNGRMADNATGKIYELEFQGTASDCSRKQVLNATTFSVITNFPKVEAPAVSEPTK